MPKTVLVFGTFDILHPGHEFFLKEAKKEGDFLEVVVARDETVLNVKGKLPQNNEAARLEKLKSLPYVKTAILGNAGDKYGIIEELKPDVIVLGYDQSTFTEGLEKELKKRGIKTKIVRLEKSLRPDIYKSSKMRRAARSMP
ncbi:MAG: adenylyltransferase/cytidyltransferase family protein [Candidatus Aenigmatarchaeota archaeon]